MSGNVIKLVFRSLADSSAITKWNDNVKASIGNMGAASRAAQTLGSAMGGVGGAVGRLVGALAQGSVWGIAMQGISMLVDGLGHFKARAEEAEERISSLGEAMRSALRSAGQTAAKASNIPGVVTDAAAAKLAEAEKNVAAAKRHLDNMQRKAREAQDALDRAEGALAEKSKPVEMRTMGVYGSTSYTMRRDTTAEKAAVKEANMTLDTAEKVVEEAKAAYEAEMDRLRVAREAARLAKESEKEQKAAAKKAAEQQAAAAESLKKAADKKATEEWLKRMKEAQRRAAEAEWIEHQKNYRRDKEAALQWERDRLGTQKAANTDRATDLAAKLKAAQEEAANAFSLFRSSDSLDQGAERRAARQERIDRERLNDRALDLQARRKDWRTARNLSNRDEAARRWLLANENVQKNKNELKGVEDKLDSIKLLLEAATTI